MPVFIGILFIGGGGLFIKAAFFLFFFICTLPWVQYDQLMSLLWKAYLSLSLMF